MRIRFLRHILIFIRPLTLFIFIVVQYKFSGFGHISHPLPISERDTGREWDSKINIGDINKPYIKRTVRKKYYYCRKKSERNNKNHLQGGKLHAHTHTCLWVNISTGGLSVYNNMSCFEVEQVNAYQGNQHRFVLIYENITYNVYLVEHEEYMAVERSRTGKTEKTHTHICLASHALYACERLMVLSAFTVGLFSNLRKRSSFRYSIWPCSSVFYPASWSFSIFLSSGLVLALWSRSVKCIILTWLNHMLKNSTPNHVTCWCLVFVHISAIAKWNNELIREM